MKRVICASLVVTLLFGGTFVKADDDTTNIKPATTSKKRSKVVIPVIRVSGTISEQPVPEDMPFSFSGTQAQSLRSILTRLKKVESDDNVPAMVLQLNVATLGRAQAEEIVRALNAIKATGKTIHVHTDLFTTGQLALIGNASEISMVPTGYMFITGLYGEQVFLRGMLDKIGVTPDYFTCGDYKSAGEMFMRKSPSAEAAEMSKWLYDGLYGSTVAAIAKGRSVSDETARKWIDEGVFTAERAVTEGIIDVVEHTQEFEERLRASYGENLAFDRRYGMKASSIPDLSSPFGILNFYAELLAPSHQRKSKRPGVAIVYLEGAIMPGDGGGNPLFADAAAFGDQIRKSLDEAAEDDAIKAVVFRVNSPGGSAVASEVILNATKRVAAKKPFVVSMGNVAASGGYYVACGTDTIFAEESTITGSIGVVVGKFATTGLWNKLGISFTPIERGNNAAMMSSAAVFSDSERTAIRSYMDEVYEVFKGHVTFARSGLTKPIDEIAGGRVYTGRQALELGLVDKIGGLNDAIALAAEKAGLENGYDVRVVPRTKGFMELLMSDLGGPKDDGKHLSLSSSMPAGVRSSLHPLLEIAIPVLQSIDSGRALAVKQALLQLMILQSEKVSLTSPVMLLSEQSNE